MTMRSWIRNVFTHPVTRPIRRGPARTSLSLQGLEDRAVPAIFTVSNIADSGFGSLRDAVDLANSTAGATRLTLTPVSTRRRRSH